MNRIKGIIKKYFIPHEGNDHKPHILRPRIVVFVCMVALVAEATFLLGAKYVIPQSKLFGIIEVNALVDGTNQNRVTNGLPELQVSPLLQAAAQDKANDMVANGYFAHTSPTGVTPWDWLNKVGYSYIYAGENLAANFSDSQDVITAWMNSPEHRANILSTDFTQVGIATVQGMYDGKPAVLVVEEFGTPAPAPLTFVNTAAAATMPATAVPAATMPTPKVIAAQSSSDANTPQTFVAVKNTVAQENQIVPPAPAITTSAPLASPAVTSANSDSGSFTQSNIVQMAFSNPKAMTDDFYFIIMTIFALALVLNIFIKIRVQHPRLIASGIFVIVAAGLFVMLNQNIGLLHVVVV
jgi:hypothetical protein